MRRGGWCWFRVGVYETPKLGIVFNRSGAHVSFGRSEYAIIYIPKKRR